MEAPIGGGGDSGGGLMLVELGGDCVGIQRHPSWHQYMMMQTFNQEFLGTFQEDSLLGLQVLSTSIISFPRTINKMVPKNIDDNTDFSYPSQM